MPYAHREDLRIYFEVCGPEAGVPLVLVHGLTAQLIHYHPSFVELVNEIGFRTALLDNRDAGLSTHFDGAGEHPYQLQDMVDDVVSVLDALSWRSAHAFGVSMGGMIVQQLAISYPDRVRSLTSFISRPNNSYLREDPERAAVAALPKPTNREDAVQRWIARERTSGLVGFTDEQVRALAEATYDRDYSPEAEARQRAAILSSADRLPGLRALKMPATIVQGRDDRVIPWKAGVDMAEAMPTADLHVIKGMGHQMRPDLFRVHAAQMRYTAQRAGDLLPA